VATDKVRGNAGQNEGSRRPGSTNLVPEKATERWVIAEGVPARKVKREKKGGLKKEGRRRCVRKKEN